MQNSLRLNHRRQKLINSRCKQTQRLCSRKRTAEKKWVLESNRHLQGEENTWKSVLCPGVMVGNDQFVFSAAGAWIATLNPAYCHSKVLRRSLPGQLMSADGADGFNTSWWLWILILPARIPWSKRVLQPPYQVASFSSFCWKADCYLVRKIARWVTGILRFFDTTLVERKSVYSTGGPRGNKPETQQFHSDRLAGKYPANSRQP